MDSKKEALRYMKLKEHIFLIGFMGCGKSTNARYLAKMTDAEQLEMDQKIVKDQGMAITEIFAQFGEPYFRDLETDVIRSLKDLEPMVVSCGGGAVLREENVALMKAHTPRISENVALTSAVARPGVFSSPMRAAAITGTIISQISMVEISI